MARLRFAAALIVGPFMSACLNGDFSTKCAGENACTIADSSSQDSAVEVSDSGVDTATIDSFADAADSDVLTQLARIEKGCARLTACNQGVGAIDFAACMRAHVLTSIADVSGHPLHASLWTCIDAATSCSDIDICLGGASAPAACSGKSAGNYCVGGNLLKCSGTVNVGATACALAGQDCVPTSASDAACAGKAACSSTSAPTCSSSTELMQCSSALDIGADCASLGGICGSSSSAGVGCTGDDAPCDTASVTCGDATTAMVCRNGHLAKIDCAAFLSSCAAASSGDVTDMTRGCLATGGDCTSGPPTCDGTSLRYCIGGHFRLVDCGALGLTACATLTTASGPSAACGR